jgi:hypothetical protein
MADDTRDRALGLIRHFLDRATFRKFIRARSLTADEAIQGLYCSEYLFGPHHRNLAPIGLYKIVTGTTSGYEAMAPPPEFVTDFSNIYKTVEVEPGKFEQILTEGVLLLTASTHPIVVELKRGDDGLWLRAWTRSESTQIGRDLVEGIRIFCLKNNALKGKKLDPQGRFLNVGRYTWNDLILPEPVKRYIIQDVAGFVERLAIYRRFGLKTKRGFLFSGPPGTGKTLTAKVLACEVKSTLVWATSRDLAEASNVREVFRIARDLAPTILLFEDADLYAFDRRTGNRSAVMGEIFNCLDGLEDLEDVITVMTTNYADKLERALIDRPGRFDKEIHFDYPDAALAVAMTQRFVSSFLVRDGTPQL